jgi:hypothetical protein
MATTMKSSRTKKSGSTRAEHERLNLKKSGLLAYAEGFSKTCIKPVKRISVEMQVSTVSEGGVESGLIIDLVPDVEFHNTVYGAGWCQPERVVLKLDPSTGEIKFLEMQSV